MRAAFKLCTISIGVSLGIVGEAPAAAPPDIIVSDANYNTAMGSAALSANTSGELNTAAGQYVLTINTTGSSNTAFGAQALENNVTGNYNTATNGVTATL